MAYVKWFVLTWDLFTEHQKTEVCKYLKLHELILKAKISLRHINGTDFPTIPLQAQEECRKSEVIIF